jgi:tetratricopeptide (TPR) repeat protein
MTTAVSPNPGATWHFISLFLVVLLLAFKLHGAGPDAAKQDFQKGYQFHAAEGEAQDLEKALQYYRRAIKADPTLFPALSNAALIYFARRDYKKAKHFFSETINAARGDSEISSDQIAKSYSDLGGCYFREGNLGKAEQWFRASIQLDPGLVEAHFNLINLMLKAERIDEARSTIEMANLAAPSTRYGLFEGRLKSRDSGEEWNPLWMKL